MKRIDSPRIKLLYDIYHMQIMDGDIARTIRDNIQYLAHLHTGGNPGRHEIDDTQELNYHFVAQAGLSQAPPVIVVGLLRAPLQLAQDRSMIEIHFLTEQIVILENEDESALNLHQTPRGRDSGPDATMRSAEFAFDDHRLFGVIERQLLEPEIREGPQQLTEQTFHCFRAVYDRSHGRNLIAGMAEGCQCGGNIVFYRFRFNVGVHYRLAAFPETLCACSCHFRNPQFAA
jgi:hypothetical protein